MANRITIWCSSFCSSAISAVFWSALPSPASLFCIAILAVTLLLMSWATARSAAPCWHTAISYSILWTGLSGALTGVLWMASVGHSYLSWQLPEHKIQQDARVLGQVVSAGCLKAVQQQETDTKSYPLTHTYSAKVTQLDGEKISPAVSMLLRTLNPTPCLHNGDRFSAIVRVKPAYGSINPVGFNFQQYLASQQVVASGYIKTLLPLTDDQSLIDHRHGIDYQLNAQLVSLALVNTRWWQALLLGNRQALTPQDWQLIQVTGTAHLFSISGMHLGIVAATTFYICSFMYLICYRLLPRIGTTISIRGAVLFCVLVTAFGYAFISGMALPVMRAYMLLALVSLCAIGRIGITPFSLMVMMVFFCLLFFPLSILQASFYLSIGAVLFIGLLNWRFRLSSRPWYVGLLVIQIAISLAMLPLTLLWFGSASIIGVVANLLIVPVITVMLPIALSLLWIVYSVPTGEWAALGFIALDGMFSHVLALLVFFQQLPFSHFSFAVEPLGLVSLLAVIILLLLPPWRSRGLCIAVCTLPVFFSALPFSDSRWYLHVFDAGQGTAMAITRGQRSIVVDTGPSFDGYSPIVESILPWFLRQINSSTIDMVIISHDDIDHAGGAPSLAQWRLGNNHNPLWFSPTSGCEEGKQLRWQGLSIQFLWPEVGNTENSNNTSCVLKVSDRVHSVLLPGDIERTSEYALIKTKQNLIANVLLTPHHGSSTSSTNAFIKAVAPQIVIHTQGYENRWQFPSYRVYQRYHQYGARQFTTSESGYIRLEFSETDIIVSPLRGNLRQRWYLPRKPPRHLQD